jgi:endonuclease/exonuclease/phosphatase family metal-dependent hydrolase
VFALDRIFSKPQEALIGIDVHTSTLARIASEHLPVTAKIRAVGEPL